MNKSNWWAHPGLRLAFLRQLHSYVGAFIAPSVLFFAVTGALQLFSLHEAHGDYAPPQLIEKLAKVHKDQVFEAARRRPKPEAAPAAKSAEPAHKDADHEDADHDHDHGHDHERGPKLGTLLLKWMFLAVAVGLSLSTLLGVWMGVAHNRRKGVIWALLILGALLPVALLAM